MATIASKPDSLGGAKHPDTLAEYSRRIVKLLGSLKLTVALFALSLVTVLVGTLAQDEMNMLEVKQRYFLSWPLAIRRQGSSIMASSRLFIRSR